MASTEIHVDAPPEAVWEVLADPRLYANWVVGASTTRDVEGPWPQVGATLHHSQVMVLHDTTTVLRSEPQRRLVLEARVRPLIVTIVDLELFAQDGGTRVAMHEQADGGLLAALPRAATDPVLGLRNRETMRRLKRLAEIGLGLGHA